ncbi:MAG: helix-turn-helix transcriptional regulator [bacterium]|nr:helix-turn-helix transcriptional regulator [bacterium]
MVNKREVKYNHIGTKLSAVREELKMTLDAVSQETGISRSYISAFERGFKLPTAKYLKYLYERRKVDLNYIFGGEFQMFRTDDESKYLNFGKMQKEVDEILHFIMEIPHALFFILGSFSEYKIMNKELIDKYRSATADRGEKGKTG